MTEHVNLSDPHIHEPRGATLATAGQVYVSDGSGSGVWEDAPIKGSSSATTDQVLVASGGGNTSWQSLQDVAVGSVSIANSSSVVALTAGGLHDPSSYTNISDKYTEDYAVGGLTIDAGKKFIVPKDGVYRISVWLSLSSDASSNPTIGLDISINGVAGGANSSVVQSKQKDANDIVTLTGHGTGILVAGLEVGLSIASTSATNVTIYDSVFDLQRIRA